MKTPDEIKNGLGCCDTGNACRGFCPYDGTEHGIENCTSKLARDALAYIHRLERERDAAVADLKSVVASNYYSGKYCKYCKYNEPDGQCHHRCVPYSSEWGWQWRGAQEVE